MNLKQKLSSRKFWSLVAGLATTTMVLFNVGSGEIERVVAVIGSVGAVVGYMLAEAYVDGKRVENETKKEE